MVHVSNVPYNIRMAPQAEKSKKVAVGVAKAKPAEQRACDQQRLLVPPHQVPAPTPPASMHRVPWHQAALSRSWVSVQKPVQVLAISSSIDENNVVIMDITPPVPVIPTLTNPRDVTSTKNLLEERVQINSHLDLQPELNALEEVYQQAAEGIRECQEKMSCLGVVMEF